MKIINSPKWESNPQTTAFVVASSTKGTLPGFVKELKITGFSILHLKVNANKVAGDDHSIKKYIKLCKSLQKHTK